MRLLLASLSALLIAFVLCGCSKNRTPALISVSEAPARMETAFKTAPTELKGDAEKVIMGLRANTDAARVLADLRALAARPGLSAAQNEVISGVIMSLQQQLQAAAAQGDATAAQTLQKQGSTR